MITKFENYIKESPDYINYKDDEYNYDDSDAKPFFITVNKEHTDVKKLYVGDYGDIHADIKQHYDSKVDKSYPGRIWRKGKIISFWIYPNPVLFKSIIKKLESRLRLKIFNNNWLIEIRKENDGSFQIANFNSNKNFFFDRKYGETEVIPIEEYIGSLDVPEEEKLWHLMNAEEKRIAKLQGKAPDFKGWGSDMTAWDGPNPLWWRQAKYQEKFNIDFKSYKLNENPDHINYGNVSVSNHDNDARPFAIVPNDNHTKVEELYIGNIREYHGKTIGTGYRKDTTISDKYQIVSAYPGRIWTDSKVISFWTYPNETLFKDIIKNLEKKLNIKIFNNGWMIEIKKEGNEIVKKEFDPTEKNKREFYFNSSDDGIDYIEIIPIEDYIGSLDQPEEEKLWHLMNAEEKRIAKLQGKAPDFKGWGSDMTAWDGPNPLWWRQAKYQENKNFNDN